MRLKAQFYDPLLALTCLGVRLLCWKDLMCWHCAGTISHARTSHWCNSVAQSSRATSARVALCNALNVAINWMERKLRTDESASAHSAVEFAPTRDSNGGKLGWL